MGLLPLAYTRPKHVDTMSLCQSRQSTDNDTNPDTSTNTGSDSSIRSGKSNVSAGVPESLTFDKIISGGTCPPMTIRDFMNYLIYIEHSAENLQFFLWYKDYVKRFVNASTADLALAPEWTQTMQDETVTRLRRENADKMRAEPVAADIFKGTDFEKQGYEMTTPPAVNVGNPFNTPPQTSSGTISQSSKSFSMRPLTFTNQAADAFQSAGAKQPFTIQPFREEINRVIATYIMDDAPRQLNLSAWEQRAAVQALSYTTHPSALGGLIKTVESTLRRQAHPNFVRWSICNGNPARVFFARALGLGLILIGFIIAFVLTLSSMGRGYRALAAIAWVLGISTLVAAYKGMCVVLHGMHHRHVRPWELFEQDPRGSSISSSSNSSQGGEDGKMSKSSFESFGSTNSYEDEPWVVKYEKRNVVRKVFDREVWIQEPALRQIQDTIFVQAMLAAVLLGGALTGIFVAVPGGNFF